MSKKSPIVIFAVVTLCGCASAPKDIAPIPISPETYESYDCERLVLEAGRTQYRLNQLAGRLGKAARNDKYIAAAATAFGWPVFALGGNEVPEAEYARLQGEHAAMQQVLATKQCVGEARKTHGAPTQ